MRFSVYIVVLLVSSPLSAHADTTGAIDTQILVQLQQSYDAAMQQLETLKAQNETLSNIKSTVNDTVKSYDQIRSISAEKIQLRLETDFEDLTDLDNMQGMSFEERVRTVQNELNRRVHDCKNKYGDCKDEIILNERFKALLEREETMAEIEKSTIDNLQTSGKDIGTRESGRISSENLSVLTLIETQRYQDELEQKKTNAADRNRQTSLYEQQKGAAKAFKETGW